jgi:hypothetical protein
VILINAKKLAHITMLSIKKLKKKRKKGKKQTNQVGMEYSAEIIQICPGPT